MEKIRPALISTILLSQFGVFTQTQALRFISERLKVKKFFSGVKKSPIDDARDILTNTVLVKKFK